MSTVTITKEDCQLILSRYFGHDNFEIKKFEFKSLGDDIKGYTCDHRILIINVLVENEDEKQIQFFAKRLLEDKFVSQTKNYVNLYEKEKFIYDLFNDGNNCDNSFVSKYYFAKDNTIILEDITLKGYSMSDDEYLNKNQVECVLKTLAKLHSNSIVYEKRKGNNYKLTDDYQYYFNECLHNKIENSWGRLWTECAKNGIITLVDLMQEFNEEKRENFKRKLNVYMNEFYKLINGSERIYKSVCCHGDVWRNNLMFKYEDGVAIDCKLVDFQLCRYLPPAHDVTFAIYHLTNNKLRQKSYDDFLDYYYQQLTQELTKHGLDVNKILSRNEYELTCKLYLIPAKLIKVFYCNLSSTSQEKQKELFQDLNKLNYIVYNDRKRYIEREFKTDDNYRKIQTNLILNLSDSLINNNVTLEDCYKIIKTKLNDNKDYSLLSYDLHCLKELSGFLGEYASLQTKILLQNREVSDDFFVKLLPKIPSQRNFIIETGGHFKEHGFFTNIVSKLIINNLITINDCVPKCYLFRLNDVSIFENLKTEGYVMLNKRKCMDYDVVKLTLKNLAKLHGSCYVLEEKLSKNKPYRLNQTFPEELKESFLGTSACVKESTNATIQGTRTEIDLFPEPSSEITDSIFKERTKLYFEALPELAKPSKRFRNTLCHGDLWASNILYKFDNGKPTNCKFVDFQSYRYVPPAHDVMQLLYLTTNRLFRSKYMDRLLDFYYDELKRFVYSFGYNLNNILTYDDFIQSCEHQKQFAITLCVSHFHNILLTSEQLKSFLSVPEYTKRIFFQDRSELILKTCAMDPEYKEKLHESIKDFRELCANLPDTLR